METTDRPIVGFRFQLPATEQDSTRHIITVDHVVDEGDAWLVAGHKLNGQQYQRRVPYPARDDESRPVPAATTSPDDLTRAERREDYPARDDDVQLPPVDAPHEVLSAFADGYGQGYAQGAGCRIDDGHFAVICRNVNGRRLPALNVKVYAGQSGDRVRADLLDAARAYAMDELPVIEGQPFVDYIAGLDERTMETYDEMAREDGWTQAQTEADQHFGSDVKGRVYADGRSGGWLVVDGLPDVETWERSDFERWAAFAHIVEALVRDHPRRVVSAAYLNGYEGRDEAPVVGDGFTEGETVEVWRTEGTVTGIVIGRTDAGDIIVRVDQATIIEADPDDVSVPDDDGEPEPDDDDEGDGEWRQTACRRCGFDVEGQIGGDEWRDRGGSTTCPTFAKRDQDGQAVEREPDLPHVPALPEFGVTEPPPGELHVTPDGEGWYLAHATTTDRYGTILGEGATAAEAFAAARRTVDEGDEPEWIGSRAAEVARRYGLSPDHEAWAEVVEDPYVHRFMLIERSTITGECMLSRHPLPEGAARYHDEQEYAEDWVVEALVDLRTREVLYATHRTSFHPYPDNPALPTALTGFTEGGE